MRRWPWTVWTCEGDPPNEKGTGTDSEYRNGACPLCPRTRQDAPSPFALTLARNGPGSLRIERLEFSWHKLSVNPDRFAVELDAASSAFASLDLHEVPVDS